MISRVPDPQLCVCESRIDQEQMRIWRYTVPIMVQIPAAVCAFVSYTNSTDISMDSGFRSGQKLFRRYKTVNEPNQF